MERRDTITRWCVRLTRRGRTNSFQFVDLQEPGGVVDGDDEHTIAINAVDEALLALNQLPIDFFVILGNHTSRKRVSGQLFHSFHDALRETARRDRRVDRDILE